MTNYVICERSLHHAHAGSKARDDIRQVLESQSWQPFEVRPGENKGYFDKLVCVGRTLADWHRLERTVRCGDVVLVQFPLIMYNKVSLYALPSVRRMKARGALFVFLIHDLETLRGYSYTDFDKQWVTEADLLISHNPRMSEVLRKYGATVPIVEIGIFDLPAAASESCARGTASRHRYRGKSQPWQSRIRVSAGRAIPQSRHQSVRAEI